MDKLDIDKLKSLPTDLNNLKSNDHKLDVHKLKSVSFDPEKGNDVVDNDVVEIFF